MTDWKKCLRNSFKIGYHRVQVFEVKTWRAVFKFSNHAKAKFESVIFADGFAIVHSFTSLLAVTLKKNSRTSTICYNFFFFSQKIFYRIVRYWFIYSCGKIKRYNAFELLPSLLAKIFGHLRMWTSMCYCLHARLTTLVICMRRNSKYVLSRLILKLSKVFEIMLST